MKKNFKFYIIIWATLLAIYNLAVFLVRPVVPGFDITYDARFWVAWAVVIITYIGQLFCAKIAFDSKNNEKLFLNIPLVTYSFTAIIVETIVSGICMLIPNCPAWISAILCVIVLGISIISVTKAKIAADIVSDTDDKIKTQTFFIKSLTIDAETLMNSAKSDAVKEECKKVYETVRYSDPMSNSVLSSVESEITIKFSELKKAVESDDAEEVGNIANSFCILMNDRNNKCKLLK